MQILALIVATVANFLLGGVWYSLLFGKIWAREEGLTKEDLKCHSSTPYIASLVCSFLAAIGFNYLVMQSPSLEYNLIVGGIVGILLVATSLCTHYQFAGRSNKLLLIDTGYHVAQFIMYAFIFWFVQ